jgi:hypothetical protein
MFTTPAAEDRGSGKAIGKERKILYSCRAEVMMPKDMPTTDIGTACSAVPSCMSKIMIN